MTSYHPVQTPTNDVSKGDRGVNPRETARWPSILTIGWISRLIQRGAIAPLTEDDTWPLPAHDTAAALHDRFEPHWAFEKIRAVPRLHYALWLTFRGQILRDLFLYFVYAGMMLLQPILIQSILQCIEQDPVVHTSMHITNGYVLAALLTALSFVSITLIDYAQYSNSHTGCNAKSIVLDLVFRKTLMLSGAAAVGLSTGDIVTLASVDADRIFMGFSFGYWALVGPLMLLAVYILIGYQLGAVVGVIGGVTMFLALYVGYVSGRKVGDIRRDLLKVQASRVKLTNEVLQGIRVVKLYAWEASLEAQLATIRDHEIALLKKYHTRRTFNTVLLYIAPVISLAICLLVYVALGHTLTAPIAFTALAYVNVARFPCTVFSTSIMMTAEMLASCERIGTYLASTNVVAAIDAPVYNGPTTVAMTDAAFSWATSTPDIEASSLTLRDLTFTLTPGSLTIVVGPVGSGKSSLVSAILGEIPHVHGHRNVAGRLSYVSQEPWIQHATIKNNILFHADDDDDDYYHRVLAACQLGPDLAMLPLGDATEIGERGINLSGGQKARVSLARSVYHQSADIYLLDDPLSALDVHVATAVFHECIRGLLGGKTTILVLNSHYHFLPLADRVLLMDNGSIVGDGCFESLKTDFPHLMNFTESNATQDDNDDSASPSLDKPTPPKETGASVQKAGGGLMDKEDRATGAVSAATYKTYFGSSGYNGLVVAASICVFLTLSQTALAMTDWFMSYWSNHATMMAKVSSGYIYLGCAVVSVVLVYGRSLYILMVAIKCSQSLHALLLRKVLAAPVPTFFDVTPIGRILNRFSSDLDQTDSQLPYFGLLLLQFVFQIVAVLIVCVVSTPYILIVYVPLAYLFFKVQQYYNKSSTELKRLESTSRSPVVTSVAETLSGLSTIRAFNKTRIILAKQRASVDHYMSFSFLFTCAGRWFQMRLDWLSAAIIAGVAFICILTKASIGIAAAGLTLTYASQLSVFLSNTAKMLNMVENLMTSVERLSHYKSLENEDESTIGRVTVDAAWPSAGVITFCNYSMRYREHLDLVLNQVSFTVPSGAKVGICGRTGSGKSSLMAALFRMVPRASGSIAIDDVDIATVSVTTLRSRLTIIPQDPVLFSGSLRFNLDPSGTAGDDELWRVLKQVHLAEGVASLDDEVAERGSNFSVGQRQLLCIARALLRRSQVVVLDEATASIDLESDKRIQATITECFVGITMLIIAHRLDTIIDSDRILVLDAGRVVEYDTPNVLLAKADGEFATLAAQAQLQRPL
ncbi:hypothetical protein SDRG_14673 [Saprolegnia diclina VS20]|uniref:ATP-binding Cassette (ABC) Superfamily n=1 Tax=Saprolegnia diclina (strain VS20) TaxID=1156394 RepID=T0PQ70_SAPDV|nr:hypothetical protein SDRG_14673 [Saprolegnia diclina VS20]EQC27624.1 hypothetical protein SDRG_14673 [Saprolegnia diclina VS20]|eukprot:XP_008619044.1 hypothetical protein SDRG_14673 [Saprolegnia diclina VS20]